MEKLYANIKERRLELGLTQDDLAKKMGYADKSMIAKIEAGRIDLAQSKILAFAGALDTTPSILMGWEDDPDEAPAQYALTRREQDLVDGYRTLNDEGQDKVSSYLRDLQDSGRYDKTSPEAPPWRAEVAG